MSQENENPKPETPPSMSTQDPPGSEPSDPSDPTIEAAHSQPANARLGLFRVVRLCRKELREILRDRRTTITLVLMPLLAYPLLAVSFNGLLSSSVQSNAPTQVVLGVASEEDRSELLRFMALGQHLLHPPTEGDGEDQSEPNAEQEPPPVMVRVGSNLEQMVADALADISVRLFDTEAPDVPQIGRPLRCELILRPGSGVSEFAAAFVEERLEAVNDAFVQQMMTEVSRRRMVPRGLELPTQSRRVEMASSDGPFAMTAFIPLILILMTITGAVYPAIDLTAGERERNTLETLMAAPVPRIGLLCAKYIAVVTVAMMTAGANLIAMSVTLLVTPGLGELVFGEQGLTLVLVDQVFILLVLFAAFYSAILLAVTSFARSFKEAQAYLIPLMLMTLIPGMFSTMPGLQLNGTLAVTPLLNIVLLARDLLEGDVNPMLAGVTVVSTLIYAIAAVALAARIFGTDAILYGSQATWSDLLRRPQEATDVATVAGAMMFLAITFPIYFLLANGLQGFAGTSINVRLGLSAAVTAIVFGVLPLVAALIQRLRLKTSFQLRLPGLLAVFGAVALGVSLWPWAHEIFLLNRFLGLQTLGEGQIEAARELLAQLGDLSPVLILLTLAVTPAIFEEWFFRGYLLSAFRGSLPVFSSVLLSAVLFGMFHVVASSILATERFLPSAFLGMILGWVCLRTGSLLPGIVIHGCHNGLLLLIAHYRDELTARGWGIEEQTHMPPQWLAGAGVAVLFGVALVFFSKRRGLTK